MAQAVYSYVADPYVVALQWTGDNLADFADSGFTSDNVAVAQDGTTLVLGAQVPGYSALQYVAIPLNSWAVSTQQTDELADPPTPMYQLYINILDPDSFAATYTPAS